MLPSRAFILPRVYVFVNTEPANSSGFQENFRYSRSAKEALNNSLSCAKISPIVRRISRVAVFDRIKRPGLPDRPFRATFAANF
jgi:hypothetical protein